MSLGRDYVLDLKRRDDRRKFTAERKMERDAVSLAERMLHLFARQIEAVEEGSFSKHGADASKTRLKKRRVRKLSV